MIKKFTVFKIKDNIYFHESTYFKNGESRVVNAHDFEYSFNRLINKNIASPGAWVLNNVKSFKAINIQFFKLNFSQNLTFLEILTMKYCSVVPKEIVDSLGAIFKKPIGTGPFKFKRWDENIKLV